MELTFKSLEHQGWNERAAAYDDYTAKFTDYGIAPLIDAVGLSAGMSVLDVCCGTGRVTKAATVKGAIATGVDISEEMISIAAAKVLNCTFQVADAEKLPFHDAAFDRAICNFGLYHLPNPDQAINDAARVLKRGGLYAFTTWCGPDKSPLFRILPEVIKDHGQLDVGLPPAPPAFRLADPNEAHRDMTTAGFAQIAFKDVPAVFECPENQIIDFLAKSTVRMTMVLQAQSPSARDAIHHAIRDRLSVFAADNTIRIPMPAILVSGTKS